METPRYLCFKHRTDPLRLLFYTKRNSPPRKRPHNLHRNSKTEGWKDVEDGPLGKKDKLFLSTQCELLLLNAMGASLSFFNFSFSTNCAHCLNSVVISSNLPPEGSKVQTLILTEFWYSGLITKSSLYYCCKKYIKSSKLP